MSRFAPWLGRSFGGTAGRDAGAAAAVAPSKVRRGMPFSVDETGPAAVYWAYRRSIEGGAGMLVWFRIAVVYFVVAVLLGLGMGATGNLALYTVHSHMNLLGWESLALIGLIYHRLPAIGRNRLAVTQFWLHNTGLPVMMLALTAKGLGSTRMEPVLGVSSAIVAAAVVLFAINVLVYGSRAVTSGAPAVDAIA